MCAAWPARGPSWAGLLLQEAGSCTPAFFAVEWKLLKRSREAPEVRRNTSGSECSGVP